MKKNVKVIIKLMLILLFISSTVFTNIVDAATQNPTVSAHAYTVMDSNTGKILYTQDGDKRIYPASTVKMMTALIAVENSSLSRKITVKQSVLSNIAEDASQVGLKAGTTYTLEELLHMLLISSAADAADTIADAISGSTSKFIDEMNKKAKLLGMEDSKFDNTIGLDIGNNFYNTYSTSNDIAKLTKEVMKNTTIRNIVCKSSYTIKRFNNGSSKTIMNTNRFLRDQWYPKDLYKIIGTKTGTTNAAGYALATTAKDNNGREIICSFFGNKTRTKMYEDIQSLLTYTYQNLNITDKPPLINAKDVTIRIGTTFNPLNSVTASDEEDGDLTNKIQVIENTVDLLKAGSYKIVYKVTDSAGNSTTKEIKVSIVDKGELIDINGHWAESQVKDFISKGYVNGYDDFTFRPNNSITRAEFVKLLNKVFGLTNSSGKVFNDTKNHWAKNEIDIAVTNGVANGISATEFNPDEFITREQVATMISNYMKLYDKNHNKINEYTDSGNVSDWAKDSVEGVIEKGYMNGYTDNTFRPKNNMTRGEAVTALSRVI